MSIALQIIAVILFVIATLVALGTASVTWAAAMIPAGLACWCGSELLRDHGR